jgi:DNA modification methylase
MDNKMFFGDNLDILRNDIKDETIDLIYLDPPFNSKSNYNLLFKSPKGHKANAQITAFEDTWHWGEQAEREFNELVQQSNTDVSEMMQALRRFLGENDMMAYLTMIANRLIELHRVLKPTGSLYLHCDPTASHFLKIVLDGVFGKQHFVNEVIWKRTTAHNDPKKYGNIHDCIFFYEKDEKRTWNPMFHEYGAEYTETKYRHSDERGVYRLSDLTAPAHGESGRWEWRGFTPPPGRMWRFTVENLEALVLENQIYWTPRGRGGGPGFPQFKRYLTETGTPLQSVWIDISPINSQAQERLGYPTQKPLALLERIIAASSNEGDIVLDPFCGCGTAIHAAEKLKRRWIGIDITHLAISLVEKRLKDAFPDITFDVHGTPKDFESARNLAEREKYEFQYWACSLVNAQPFQGKKRGADSGIDGLIYFQDDKTMPKKIIVSVKGGENVSVPMVRDLGHVIDREKASIGLFITLAKPTRPMKEEAIKAGYYESPSGANFPKIQILTIEGLLNGTERANFPDLMRGGLMFKKTKTDIKEKQDKMF